MVSCQLWNTLAHPLSGDGYVNVTGMFFYKVQLLDGLNSEVLFVKPITPGIVLLWKNLINYSDSGMYIDNPMELTLHEFGHLNMDCHVKLVQLKVVWWEFPGQGNHNFLNWIE